MRLALAGLIVATDRLMSARPPFAPSPASDEDELSQLFDALALSRAEAEEADGFQLVEARVGTPPVAVAKATPKLSARPKAAPRVQPRRFYVVTSVPVADLAKLGIHHGTWRQVGVPHDSLADSGWTLRVFDSREEALAFWTARRPDDVCPEIHHGQQ